jgi:glycosyltransferase involved in cell wall biosynthesis
MKKEVLILAIGFLPNIGGLETHLKDLIDELLKKGWKVVVLTYQPLHTPILGKWIEKKENLVIYRLPAIRGLFYKFLSSPLLEFLFLEPLLFLFTPFLLLLNPNIRTINGQGLIAGFAAAFWSKIFTKRFVVSVQSVYSFPKSGLYHNISAWIFKSANKIIAISTQAAKDIQSLGISENKIQIYTNWENSELFKPIPKGKAKQVIGIPNQFVVSFFGRLVEEKGIKPLLEAVPLINKEIILAIYGEGPLLDLVLKSSKENTNVIYNKTISPDQLPLHYSAANLIVMPSLHEEGFGRVAAGALFCGTPVVVSNKGALPEVVNDSVGKVINPTVLEIARAINFFYSHSEVLKKKASKCREYALKKFNIENAEDIIKTYY